MAVGQEFVLKCFETREGYAERYRVLMRAVDIAESRTELYADEPEKLSFLVYWTKKLNDLQNQLGDMIMDEARHHGIDFTELDTYYHVFRGRVIQFVLRKPDY